MRGEARPSTRELFHLGIVARFVQQLVSFSGSYYVPGRTTCFDLQSTPTGQRGPRMWSWRDAILGGICTRVCTARGCAQFCAVAHDRFDCLLGSTGGGGHFDPRRGIRHRRVPRLPRARPDPLRARHRNQPSPHQRPGTCRGHHRPRELSRVDPCHRPEALPRHPRPRRRRGRRQLLGRHPAIRADDRRPSWRNVLLVRRVLQRVRARHEPRLGERPLHQDPASLRVPGPVRGGVLGERNRRGRPLSGRVRVLPVVGVVPHQGRRALHHPARAFPGPGGLGLLGEHGRQLRRHRARREPRRI